MLQARLKRFFRSGQPRRGRRPAGLVAPIVLALALTGCSGFNWPAAATGNVAAGQTQALPSQVELTSGSMALAEGGASDTYTLVLTTEPADSVFIAIAGGSQLSVSPASLTFTPGDCPGSGNWCTPQTVTVSAVDDGAAEGNHSASPSHTVTSSDILYNGIAVPTLTVSIVDNDSPGVFLAQSGGSTAVTEGGASDTYTLVLTTEPADSVFIAIAGGSQLSVSPTSLTFTAGTCPGLGNWCTPQTVTVSAVNDVAAEGNHSASPSHTVTSSDTLYNGIAVPALTVSIIDNDTPGVFLAQSGGSTAVTEGGASDTYTLALTSAPAANVSIAVAGGSQLSVSPTSLTFTAGTCPGPGNWCTPQTVTVSAVDDVAAEGNHSASPSHTVTSSDTLYNGIAVPALTVSIIDNDTPTPLYLFATTTGYTGNLGGRAGADAKCVTSRGSYTFPVNSCSNVRAVISLSITDEIRDMATTYAVPATGRPVAGPTGLILQSSWNAFLAGPSLDARDADILNSGQSWWSFSQTDGSLDHDNCSGGTSTSGDGRRGDNNSAGPGFFQGGSASCSSNRRLLCLCY